MKPAEKRTFSTPMMRQYMEIKEQYKDCLLFFRLGDFYELFLEDAVIGAKALDIVLTRRPRGKDGDIPMAGIPYHAAENYIAKLVKAGHKIAICEQVSEPDSRGIVDREVIRIITPGTVMDEKSLVKNKSNYVMTLKYDSQKIGIAFLDISTGNFQVTQISHDSDHRAILYEEVRRFAPAECILSLSQYADHTLLKIISSASPVNIYDFEQWDTYAQQAEENLKKHFAVETLRGFGIDEWLHAQQAAAALLGYIETTQKRSVPHITNVQAYNPHDYLKIDDSTVRNLELFSTLHTNELAGSFIDVIDKTRTAMGGRLLKDWIRKPLRKIEEINARLDAVETLVKNEAISEQINDKLVELRDIERLLSRLSVGLGNAKDLNVLKENLEVVLDIKKLIPHNTMLLKGIYKNIDETTLSKIIKLVDKYIQTDPPSTINEGKIIKSGVNQELDKLHRLLIDGSEWLKTYEKEEKEKTGIPTLKVRFNKVFGFYVDISKPHADKVPEYYERKQTMVNAERFVTDDLKKHEKEVLSAEDKANRLELEIFNKVVGEILMYTNVVQTSAQSIAILDCINSFAVMALGNKYKKPKMSNKSTLLVSQGRHPVVEEMVAKGEFVPNDTLLNGNDHQMIVLTGPNMAGKSVYLRQTAIITLMAHIGMFVPANKAEICLVDRIFVRSGASDMISSGQSTFMVEMVETANILNHATNKSLIIMDEVGRGTSTYDGISIAFSVVEYLISNKNKRAKTLFATHYHELQELETTYPDRVKNYQVEVQEKNDEVIFLHTVKKGQASHSYGVAVAQKAGVPKQVTDKAVKRLKRLENGHVPALETSKLTEVLKSINTDEITPKQALEIITELQNKLDE